MKKRDRYMKRVYWAVFVVLSILVVGFLLFSIFNKPKYEVFSDDPKIWVEELPNNKFEINATKVTKGESFVDSNGQQYQFGPYRTVFNYEGWYKGEHFIRKHYDWNGKLIMKVGPEMDPSDGVIEGYVVQELNEDKHYIYIFLDSDWKNNVKNTTIFWGSFFNNQRQFNFSREVKKGVYMDFVEDSDDRFQNDYSLHQGGVYVGEMKEGDSTLISLV